MPRLPRPLGSIGLIALIILSTARSASAGRRPVPLEDAAGVIGTIGAGLIRDLRARFGVDASQVPTVALSGPAFAAAYQELAGEPVGRVTGFELRGVVYVRDHILTVNRTIVAHELLHALSPRFAREAHARGYKNLIEGVTDYLAHQIAPQRARGRGGFPRSAYGGYEALAAELAAIVGDDALARCYFRTGFRALERAVDARRGRGYLARVVGAIARRSSAASAPTAT